MIASMPRPYRLGPKSGLVALPLLGGPTRPPPPPSPPETPPPRARRLLISHNATSWPRAPPRTPRGPGSPGWRTGPGRRPGRDSHRRPRGRPRPATSPPDRPGRHFGNHHHPTAGAAQHLGGGSAAVISARYSDSSSSSAAVNFSAVQGSRRARRTQPARQGWSGCRPAPSLVRPCGGDGKLLAATWCSQAASLARRPARRARRSGMAEQRHVRQPVAVGGQAVEDPAVVRRDPIASGCPGSSGGTG